MLPEGDTLTFADAAAGSYRTAVLRDGRLEAMIFVGPTPTLPAPEWLKSQFERATIPPLSAAPCWPVGRSRERPRKGPIVCVCFQVGAARIAAAAAGGLPHRREDRARLGAGTNCGSCVPEIRRLIAAEEPAGPPSRPESAMSRREASPPRTPQPARPPRMARLATLPLFFKLDGKRVVVAGGSEAAAWKAELLSAAGATVEVWAPDPCAEMEALAAEPPAALRPAAQLVAAERLRRGRARRRRGG